NLQSKCNPKLICLSANSAVCLENSIIRRNCFYTCTNMGWRSLLLELHSSRPFRKHSAVGNYFFYFAALLLVTVQLNFYVQCFVWFHFPGITLVSAVSLNASRK